MTESIDDGELSLPSEFLPDDFSSPSSSSSSSSSSEDDSSSHLPSEFPYAFASDLRFMGDEEMHIAGLTRRMAHDFLQEDDGSPTILLSRDDPKIPDMAVSPQSTLSGFGSRSGSDKGSPKVSSPLSIPFEQQRDLLSAAAGKVVRLRRTDQEEQPKLHQHGFLGPPTMHSPVPVPPKNPTSLIVNQQQQLQAEQFYQQQTQQQLMKQQRTGRGKRSERPMGLPSSALPPPPPLMPQHQQLYPQSGSGLRAVFLRSDSGTRRESAGTGVFLPRRPGNPTELHKKPPGTTVLLPDRVIQVLNLNLDDMGAHPRLSRGPPLHRSGGGGVVVLERRGNALLAQHKSNEHCIMANKELCLPAEWTY